MNEVQFARRSLISHLFSCHNHLTRYCFHSFNTCSTMAELGAIANGVALASIIIQVGDGLFRLKRFWDQVKSAPEDISYLLEEIDTMYVVISEISHPRNGIKTTSPATTKCIALYRRTADTLEEVAKKLDKEIKGKKIFGGVKATLKKSTIGGLRERLRNVQFMMLLSNQAYFEYTTHSGCASINC